MKYEHWKWAEGFQYAVKYYNSMINTKPIDKTNELKELFKARDKAEEAQRQEMEAYFNETL